LEHVGDLLDGVVSSLGGRIGLSGATVLWADWEAIAGPKWATASPLKLEAGVLSVGVPDGTTATRLRYDVGSLIRRIEDQLGADIVASVRLRVQRPERRPS
jgi:hypothetical protein